jgi:hypothetical protein
MNELNEIAALAAEYVNNTDRHIFLTGKAGTGKTTFLKYIVEHTYKNSIVAAPTGIAAINAGGVTLHSLLQLPFGMYLPENIALHSTAMQVNMPQTLFQDRKFNASKRKLLSELELLIIDEVSMLRADLLDCIDQTLRYLRKRKMEPFGGLQILFIGDLLQLPPVVKDDENEILRRYYSSNYFYEARALKEQAPIRIALQKIYRQSDQKFVDVLNRLRHNEQTNEDIGLLNGHYEPEEELSKRTGYIHLTTHNYKADKINLGHLAKLDKKLFSYKANCSGEFPENMYPTEQDLQLKVGAQVMFIKNDPSGESLFYNGKIGIVTALHDDAIQVECDDNNIEVSQYEWENKRYVLNKNNNEIDEKHLGSFVQYPLRLAWAVTVHKSQGLTFEKAILDLSGSFAPGQLYVALSRLTSLDGLLLSSKLPENPPSIDLSLIQFNKSFEEKEELTDNLVNERKTFIYKFAKEAFDFQPVLRSLNYHLQGFNKSENRSLKQQYLSWTQELQLSTDSLKSVGEKFIVQVQNLLNLDPYLPELKERLNKAQLYFQKELIGLEERITLHRKAMKKESKTKAYVKELNEIESLFGAKNKKILKLSMLVDHIANDMILTKEKLRESTLYKNTDKKVTAKKDKTPTSDISFGMYKDGLNMEEIAEKRELVLSTIQGHLSKYVELGDVNVKTLIDPKMLDEVLGQYKKGVRVSGEIKAILSDDYTYGDIKLALAHAHWLENK